MGSSNPRSALRCNRRRSQSPPLSKLARVLGLSASLMATQLVGCSRQHQASDTDGVRAHGFAQAAALAFIEDDYPKALAQARAHQRPLFVDVWASWCHTCLSLRQYVLPDPAMVSLKDSFVFASIDSERAVNSAFLQKFPNRSLPTLWVIDPATEAPLLKWVGTATAEELSLLLRQTLESSSTAGTAQQAAAETQSAALWLRAQRASAAGDAASAIALYRQSLQGAPSDWPMRAQVIEALSMRLRETHARQQTFELALNEASQLPPGTARLNVVLNAIDAGAQLAHSGQAPARYDELLQLGARIASSEPALLDDRSSLYESLVTALTSRDAAQAKSLARQWSAQLDAEAARAQLPAARRVWDAHRLEAYLALGEPARALPMLEQSQREVPDDYNPPARLARVYLVQNRPKVANAAINQALSRCDGPRKLRLYLLKAEILLAMHDKDSARATLRNALDFMQDKQLGARYEQLRETITRKLAELS